MHYALRIKLGLLIFNKKRIYGLFYK